MEDRVDVRLTADASDLVRGIGNASAALDDFGRITQKIQGVTQAFQADFGKLLAGFTASQVAASVIIEAFKGVADAFRSINAEVIEAEKATKKLNATFDGATATLSRIVDLSNQLSSGSAFFDAEDVKNAAAIFRSFDLAESEISALLPAAINLATVYGRDLDDASRRLANGLTGSTRGLREFGIVAKDGSDRIDVFAKILERGNKYADDAKKANEGLAGATAKLDKSQKDFNEALGNLLSGPNQALLTFLANATTAAANLANEMAGVSTSAADALAKTTKVFVEKTGKVEEVAPATGAVPSTLSAGTRASLEKMGLLTRDPLEKLAEERRQKEADRKRKEQEEKEKKRGRKPSTSTGKVVSISAADRAAEQQAEQNERLGRILSEASGRAWIKDFTDSAEKLIDKQSEFAKEASNVRERDLKFLKEQKDYEERIAKEIADYQKDAANETGKKLEAAGEALSRGLLFAADRAAGILGKAISGQAITAQDFIGLGTVIASAIFPAFAPLISILGTFAGTIASEAGKASTVESDREQLIRLRQELQSPFRGGSDVLRARQDVIIQEKIVALESQIAEKERATAEKNMEAARIQLDAARSRRDAEKQASRTSIQDIIDQFKPLGDKVAKRFADLATPLIEDNTAAQKFLTGFREIRQMSPEQLSVLGGKAREAIKSGDLSSLRQQFSYLTEDAFRALIATLAEIPEAAGTPGADIGDTPRNPLYVFDVTPSRDEFTRAPRGMFFRPNIQSRAVTGDQSIQRQAV